VATVVYGGTLTAGTVLFNVIWWYASKDGRLVDHSLDSGALRAR